MCKVYVSEGCTLCGGVCLPLYTRSPSNKMHRNNCGFNIQKSQRKEAYKRQPQHSNTI